MGLLAMVSHCYIYVMINIFISQGVTAKGGHASTIYMVVFDR